MMSKRSELTRDNYITVAMIGFIARGDDDAPAEILAKAREFADAVMADPELAAKAEKQAKMRKARADALRDIAARG